MNFLTLPNQNLFSNIIDGGFFAQADLPAPLAGAFVGFDSATDSLINVSLSSVFHTAPETDEFCLDLNRDDFEIGDRFDIAVRVFDENGKLQNFGSTELTIFVDEFLNDGTILFGITTRELSHDRVNPSEVARLENEAVEAYLNGETDEVPACLVEDAQISLDTTLLTSPALATLDTRFASVFGHNTEETAVLCHVALSHVLPRAPRSETIEVPLSLIEGAEGLKVAESFSVLMNLPSEGLNVRLFIVVEEIWGDIVFLRLCRREDLSRIVEEVAILGAESAIWEEAGIEEVSRLEELARWVSLFSSLDPTAHEEGADLTSQIESLSFEAGSLKVSPDFESVQSRVVSAFDLAGTDEEVLPVLWDLSSFEGIKVERGPLGGRVRLVSINAVEVLKLLKDRLTGQL